MCFSCFCHVRFLTVFDDFERYDLDTCRVPGGNSRKPKNRQNTWFLRVFKGYMKIWHLDLSILRNARKTPKNDKNMHFSCFYVHLCTHYVHTLYMDLEWQICMCTNMQNSQKRVKNG